MNGSLIFALCIIAMFVCASIIKTYLKQRGREPDVGEDLAETLEKIDVLEERIRVLERIVTQDRYDLKSEIDSL